MNKISQLSRLQALEIYANQYKLTHNAFFPEPQVFNWDDLHGVKLEIIVNKSQAGVMVTGKSEDGHLYILKYESRV